MTPDANPLISDFGSLPSHNLLLDLGKYFLNQEHLLSDFFNECCQALLLVFHILKFHPIRFQITQLILHVKKLLHALGFLKACLCGTLLH